MKTIERFKLMQNVNLGYLVNPIINDLVNFFEKIDNSSQIDITNYDSETKKLFFSYALINPDEMTVIDCLDLSYINIKYDKHNVIENFENWLMIKKNFINKYNYAKNYKGD